jgi:small subunit ribosomal protein S2
MFVIDCGKEEIAVREARKLSIPVIAVVDTNSDPDPVSYVIPGNDDALRAIRLFSAKIADAVIEGHQMSTGQPVGVAAPAEQAAHGDAAGEVPSGVGEAARYSSGAAYEDTGLGTENGSDSFGEDFVGYAEKND